jgi:cell division protein FtsB
MIASLLVLLFVMSGWFVLVAVILAFTYQSYLHHQELKVVQQRRENLRYVKGGVDERP